LGNGLVAHAAVVYLSKISFSGLGREKKIRELMEKEKKAVEELNGKTVISLPS
jgi:hypothetical protein